MKCSKAGLFGIAALPLSALLLTAGCGDEPSEGNSGGSSGMGGQAAGAPGETGGTTGASGGTGDSGEATGAVGGTGESGSTSGAPGDAGSGGAPGDGGSAGSGGDAGASGGEEASHLCTAPGTVCLISGDCAEDKYCGDGQCIPAPSAGSACVDWRCAADATCVEGQCTPRIISQEGLSCSCDACICEEGTVCVFSSGDEDLVCRRAIANLGESCGVIPCREGLYCFEDPGESLPECRLRPGEGQSCDDEYIVGSEICQPGLYCDFDGICQRFELDGQSCESTAHCEYGLYCNPQSSTCESSAPGSPCGNGKICRQSAVCREGSCEPDSGVPAGQPCLVDRCAVGTRCNDVTTCQSDHTCHLPLYVCVPEAEVGEACDAAGCTGDNFCMPTQPVAGGGPTGEIAHATKIIAASHHTCAILDGGQVKCWGANSSSTHESGTLGFKSELLPVSPANLEPRVRDLTASGEHTCALLDDGKLKCWGSNGSGQLGLGLVNLGLPPTFPVELGAPVISASAGGEHTCAVSNTLQVRCWGRGNLGQLGFPGAPQALLQPGTALALASTPALVAAGSGHTCILMTDGKVACTGSNHYGSLGTGDGPNRVAPSVPVVLPARATDLAVGGYSTFVLLETGEVMSWGSNRYDGQLGLGESVASRSTPAGPLALGGKAIAIAASSGHACALLETGQITCWGSNSTGQLGNGDSQAQPLPQAVDHGEPAIAVSVGGSHTCALFSEGRMKCWGSNSYGQLGLGDTLNRGGTPTTVPRLNPFIRL